MTTTIIQLNKLTADEGKVLTNGDVYSKEIFLGDADSADNWYEIDEADCPEPIA